jgi:hypothetical protein
MTPTAGQGGQDNGLGGGRGGRIGSLTALKASANLNIKLNPKAKMGGNPSLSVTVKGGEEDRGGTGTGGEGKVELRR